MKQDDLYLGYYLHLVQDLYYRNYLYVENHWNSAIPGNVEKLHHDYCVLNGRISQRYGLSKDKISALDITTEPICELAVFDAAWICCGSTAAVCDGIRREFICFDGGNGGGVYSACCRILY